VKTSVSTVLGSDPTPWDYAEPEAGWIDRILARQAVVWRVDSLTGADMVGRESGDYARLVIPYSHPGSDQVRE